MKYLLVLFLAVVLASCGAGGVSPNPDYPQTKGYDANQDFLTAIGYPIYILSPGEQSLPADYPVEKDKNYTDEEKLLINLAYYTPENVQKILDRVNRYLAKAKAELPKPDYEKLVPKTGYDSIKELKLTIQRVKFERAEGVSPNYRFEFDKAMTVFYSDIWFQSHPIPFEVIGTKLDELYRPSDEPAGKFPDPEDFERGDDYVTLKLPLNEIDVKNFPILKDLLADTLKIEAMYAACYSLDGYEANLKTLKTDANNPIVQIMKSFQPREKLNAYMEKNVSPKNQEAVKQKAEAFFKAWGL